MPLTLSHNVLQLLQKKERNKGKASMTGRKKREVDNVTSSTDVKCSANLLQFNMQLSGVSY